MTRPSPSEPPMAGGWADTNGPGRCRRCHAMMRRDDTCLWAVRQRASDTFSDAFQLCGACTRGVMNIWGIRPSDRLFPG